MSKLINIEIIKSELQIRWDNGHTRLLLQLTNDQEVELECLSSFESSDLVNLDIQRLIEYRNNHRKRVRDYYDKNLRRKPKAKA